MKTLLGALVIAAASIAAPAGAQPIGYVEGSLGGSVEGTLDAKGIDAVLGPFSVREKLKPGWMASLLAGRRLGDGPISVEGEAVYLSNAIKSPDLDAAFGAALGMRSWVGGALVNVKLEPAQPYGVGGVSLSPYLAAGLGFGRTDISILGDHYADDGAMWQGKAGVAVQATPRVSWDLGYRYVAAPRFDTNKRGLAAHFKTDIQALTVGVRYALGGQG